MKRIGNLYPKIISRENLELAHKNAQKGKSRYNQVQMVNKRPLLYLLKLQKDLKYKRYKTSKYRIFKVNDRGKEREICDLPYYPDRVVHWAIMQVIEPIFMSLFIKDTYAAIPGRGIHDALQSLHNAMRDRESTKYCLKLDVKKFFPNVDKEILKSLLRRKIKCKDTLWLLDEIIDSYEGSGIPIGNYTSQYFGNFYLAYFDHWMKEFPHPFTYTNEQGEQVTETRMVKHYFRYMDDMIILSDSKEFLHQLRQQIEDYLWSNLKLHLKPNYQVFPSYARGVDFVGYRSFGDFTLVRNRTKKIIKRLVRETQKHIDNKEVLTPSELGSLSSYYGAIVWGDAARLFDSTLGTLSATDIEQFVKHSKGKGKSTKKARKKGGKS